MYTNTHINLSLMIVLHFLGYDVEENEEEEQEKPPYRPDAKQPTPGKGNLTVVVTVAAVSHKMCS